jgi:hypothetical protein
MEQTYLYKVMCIANGYAELHTDDFDTIEEAQKLTDSLTAYFPDYEYYIERYEYEEPKEKREYNENAIDGWEDMYPTKD